MSQLLDRLNPQYDQTPATRAMSVSGQSHWPGGGFGAPINPVQTIIAHETDGWPRRDKADEFVRLYTVPPGNTGIGPQLYIAGDGTVARLIDLPRRTYHGEWMNGRSIGVETGCLLSAVTLPGFDSHHIALSLQATSNAQDVPGLKLWITSGEGAQTEVCPLWVTASYSGPGRGTISDGWNIFSEQQMQAWALLARYLMEEFKLPRNLPLLPHPLRSEMISGQAAAEAFRRTVLADERAEMVKRLVAAAPMNIASTSFDAANAAAMPPAYGNAVQAAVGHQSQQQNRAWTTWCKTFRGLHGHGYSGSLGFHLNTTTGQWVANSEHDCPGPLFDFHRLGREVSDYWWFPFDVAGGTANVPFRGYRNFGADTPIIEYYFDESEADRTGRIVNGLLGAPSSPDTFSLEEDAPVYAMSNGELVAACFPDPGAGVSLAFTLVRHEVYHAQARPGVVTAGAPAPAPNAIDYDQAPESVYTLYMHLGRPPNMSFQSIVDTNPDWLNRLLLRAKECELGIALYDGAPAHQGIPAAVWNNRPPGIPQRSTTLEGWRQDKNRLDFFFSSLTAGRVAVLPRSQMVVPARILLGDFLGVAGVRSTQGATHRGVRVETIAPTFEAPTFTSVGSASSGWTPGAAAAPVCMQYISEWARTPTAPEQATLVAQGVNVDQLGWWSIVALAQLLEGSLDANQRLPVGGLVFHYRPLEFAKWLNGVTWASEWPKFGVTDASGSSIPLSQRTRPTSRRV